MDPSQVQSDSANDVHSLEHGDGDDAPDQKVSNVTDATGGEGSKVVPPPNPFKHRSFIRRLWDKLNIYLLLFVFVLVLAIGALVALTMKDKQAGNKSLSTGELSQEALKQLANTDVSIGDPKQILTVQANSVFAGAVLIRDDLEVAGTIKIGGDLSLANLTVSGSSTLADVTSNNLTVGNSLNVQGTLTLKSGISVSGQSNFNGGLVTSSLTTGALELNGDLNLTHHVTAGGTIPGIAKGTAVGGGGTVSLSGSDTSGSIAINTGSSPPAGCFATVTFSETFKNTPHVVVTPIGAAAAELNYYVTRTTTNFVVCSANAAPASQSFGFDYIVLN